ncbi:hypothetical protein [Scandinavium goeteborgense]|uniref:hypothetical protein n=1 Tax=Scandinavium goeteborgense TaxID=1851514 RepID=UPI0014476DB1|nr:hypothetical protein [Scandinavium goeteborgense]QKN82180.1 hypothetical protein A8O29_013115 [Scandinavium goeteborgense]
MKALMLVAILVLSGCSGTWVHIEESGSQQACAPVVSVESLGNSVTVSDHSQCKANQ